MAIAEIKHLKKVYPTFTLTDVSFDLNAGRITGFIGRNGAGKTTTIKVMLGLAHSDLGQVSYFGIPDVYKRQVYMCTIVSRKK